MNIPADLKYAKTHEWVRMDGDTAEIGITDFAQDEMGDLVFVNLPEPGDEITAGETFADVESVKAVSDVMSPVSGTISEINEELLDDPARINEDPYGAWFIRVEGAELSDELMDAEEYAAHCEAEKEG